MELAGVTGSDLVVVAVVLGAFALVSRRLRNTPVSVAMVFVVAGVAAGTEGLGLFRAEVGSTAVRQLAEAALAIVLFTDASAVRPRLLARQAAIPVRLLTIGLPLTIATGWLAGWALLGDLGVFELLCVAILVAPTDASLGQSVVTDDRLPSGLRQGLNVESGLNDGLCVPLLVAAVAFAQLDVAPSLGPDLLVEVARDVGIAVVVGLVAGSLGAWLLVTAGGRGWVDRRWGDLVPLAIVVVSFITTTGWGGSGFVAAFVAGLAYRRVAGELEVHTSEALVEDLGRTLSAVTFFVFAAVVVGPALMGLTWQVVAFSVAALTVVRMAPVAVALAGSGSDGPTVAFAGWFGPRGLATIVFALTIVETADLPGTPVMLQVACLTVLLSVFAHGISAPPLTERFIAVEKRQSKGSAGS